MPKEGDIAYCQHRQLGLIRKAKGSAISGMTYYGIHLSQEKYGQPWQSKHPQIVGNIHDLISVAGIEEKEVAARSQAG